MVRDVSFQVESLTMINIVCCPAVMNGLQVYQIETGEPLPLFVMIGYCWLSVLVITISLSVTTTI